MPTETKNSTAKASRSGSDSCGRAMAQFGLAQHHAGEERAERERHVEQHACEERDADGCGDHAEREEFARTGACDLPEQPRKQLASAHEA